MDDHVEIQEDSFSSDEDFDDEDEELSESSTDVDEKIKMEEIFDKDFLKCYSALKRKDGKIYDKDVKFFNEKQEGESEITKEPKSLLNLNKKASKPRMTLLDHQLKLKDDDIDDVEQVRMTDGNDETVLERIKPMLSHYERELDELKNEIIKAGDNDDSDSDDSDFLIRKDSSNKDQPIAAKSRRSKIEAIPDDGDPDIKELKTLWSDPKQLSDEDKFLRDYIINKRCISNDEDEEPNNGSRYFSKDIDKLSDIESDEHEEEEEKKKKMRNRRLAKAKFHSEENKFDEIKRIPRNATQTIRDMNEKRFKQEKRLKRMEKRKKLKKKIDETEEEFRYRQGEEDKEELKKITEELDKELNSLPSGDIDAKEEKDNDDEIKKKKKKMKKRGGQKKPKVGVAPDRLLSYGLSKRKLKKSKLL